VKELQEKEAKTKKLSQMPLGFEFEEVRDSQPDSQRGGKEKGTSELASQRQSLSNGTLGSYPEMEKVLNLLGDAGLLLQITQETVRHLNKVFPVLKPSIIEGSINSELQELADARLVAHLLLLHMTPPEELLPAGIQLRLRTRLSELQAVDFHHEYFECLYENKVGTVSFEVDDQFQRRVRMNLKGSIKIN